MKWPGGLSPMRRAVRSQQCSDLHASGPQQPDWKATVYTLKHSSVISDQQEPWPPCATVLLSDVLGE